MRTFSTIDCQSLPHKMTGMLKAELNTNLLLLNNQQLSALYFMKQRPPPPTRPRTPSCPYLTRVSVVSSGGVSPPTASLHILLPLIRMLSCPAQPSAYGLLPPTLPAPNPTRVRIAFYCFGNCPADSILPQSAASDHAAVQSCVRPGDWS